MKYNVLLFTDAPNPENFTRGYGAYRIAHEIRQLGYSVLTIDFSSAMDDIIFNKIIDLAVGEETIFVGFSTTWFPLAGNILKNNKFKVGEKSLSKHDSLHNDWFYNSVAYRISRGELGYFTKIIKSKNPKIKVVVGGAKASDYVTDQSIDNVFIGYSENQVIDYIKSITGLGPKRIFNKVINYDTNANNGEFNFNNSFTDYVETDCINSHERLTIEFSRGCIFNCAFCSFPHRNQNTKNYTKYKEVLTHEFMNNWNKWGITKYVITDDTFNDYTEKLKAIHEVILSLPFKPVFYFAFIRMDLMTEEQAILLKAIGLKTAFYGLDAWEATTAKSIGKNSPKKIKGLQNAKQVWGNDVYISAYIIIGLPHDTIEGIHESAEWYITEGHKLIDNLKYVSHAINPPSSASQYQFLSRIEEDPAAWGYTFPKADDLTYWERNNGTILSKTIADSLMLIANEKVTPFNNAKIIDWNDMYDGKDPTEMYYKLTHEDYFPKLLNVLSNTN